MTTPGPWLIGTHGKHLYYVNPAIEAGEDIDDPRHDSIVVTTQFAGALSGIPDEEEDENIRLIATACNACQTINPDNPIAVAEALQFVSVAVRDAINHLSAGGPHNANLALYVLQKAHDRIRGKVTA